MHIGVMRPGLFTALALGLAASAWVAPALAATYYVAPSGDDSDPGTEQLPFRTLQHAAELMQAGDTCLARTGVYRETVKPASSGRAGAPIVFMAAPGERPLVSGLERLSIPSAGADGPLSIPVVAPVRALFWRGVLLPEARWPNANGDVLVLWPPGTATAATATSLTAQDLPDVDLTGALVDVTPGVAWWDYSRRVASWDGATKTLTFDRPINSSARLTPEAGDHFALRGAASLLDAPGEWFFDAASSTLQVLPPMGFTTASAPLEHKVRDWAFDLSERSYVEVRGFSVLGAAVSLEQASSVVVEDCHVHYPDVLLPHEGDDLGSHGIVISGTNNVWRGNTVLHTWESGLYVTGSGHQITNSVIEDVAAASSNDSGIELQASASEVSSNTVALSGRYGISFYMSQSLLIARNRIVLSCVRTDDCANAYTWNTDGVGTRIEYNWISDNASKLGTGIYLDDASPNYVVHHNVVSNVAHAGIQLKAPSEVVNNTIVEGPLAGDLQAIRVPGPVDLSASQVKNNLTRVRPRVRVSLGQPSVLDSGYHASFVPAESTWQDQRVPFSTLAQRRESAQVPLALNAIDRIIWDIDIPGSYSLEIDNVRLYPSQTPIDDLDDLDLENALGGSWAAAPGALSTATLATVQPGASSPGAIGVSGTVVSADYAQIQTTFVAPVDFSADLGIDFSIRVVIEPTYGGPSTLAQAAANLDCPVDLSDFVPRTECAIDRGSGVPGITDGFVGAAPDIGALEVGAPPWLAGATVTDGFLYLDDSAPDASGGAGSGGAGGGGSSSAVARDSSDSSGSETSAGHDGCACGMGAARSVGPTPWLAVVGVLLLGRRRRSDGCPWVAPAKIKSPIED
ncbi:MAG: right-handed parallel beta-helix repeat-containing protein [Deltaproteobacteria bacterium]